MTDNLKHQLKNNIMNHMLLVKNEDFHNNYKIALKVLTDCLKSGGHIYLAGNGGSMSDALHIAGELNCKIYKDRHPYPAHVLGSDVASLTAIANDYSYSEIFSRELKGKMKENDIFIALSTSGNSKNIIEALKIAKGLRILLTGQNKTCNASYHCDIMINTVSNLADEIQQMHQTIYHSLIYDLEEKLK